MDGRVGFGFRPTDAELLGYYLRFKLTGSTFFVDETINEIDMYSFDPWDLRFQSKVKSMDPIWYFFCSSNQETRRTSSGFWKITGQDTEIEDQWGIWCGRGIIGFKKILRFHKGRIARRGKAEWVMHEYHLTILPENQRTHVLCRVEYKGDDISFLYGNTVEFSPVSDQQLTNCAGSVFNGEGQVSHFPSHDNDLLMNIEEALDYLSDNGEPNSYTYGRGREDYNEYRPKDPVTRVFDDYSSESDNESTLFGDTSCSVDSVGDPNELISAPIPPLNSMETEEVKMEVQGKEKTKNKWGWKMAEEDSCSKITTVIKQIMKKKIYLKNMIKITAVLSIFSIIGWITLLP